MRIVPKMATFPRCPDWGFEPRSSELYMNFALTIAQELNIANEKVSAALELLEKGGTVPFIARYRKDQTGGLDEIQLRDIQHRSEYLRELQERMGTVLKTIEEQGKLTPELRARIEQCRDKTLLEDLYAPYKPKKRTRATAARELGLEPLARLIEAQESTSNTDEEIARIYLREGLADPRAAINGALDILAEEVADNPDYRGYLRTQVEKKGLLVSKVRKDFEGKPSKFENYYDFSEPMAKMPSHRVLAIRRGEKEKVLRVSVEMEDALLISWLQSQVVKTESIWKAHLERMCQDAWERLLKPSIETEVRLQIKQSADEEALKVFQKNLRDILLSPPAGHKSVLAVDPGFKSGCKLAVMDAHGKFLEHAIIYPNEPQKAVTDSARIVANLVEQHKIAMIAIGNGTASRETDAFFASIMPKLKPRPIKVVVNESGASVYSASMVAIEEFPKEDVTTRGAISIGRRLQDPLAELVKVDPKAIGVGQYQHDVNQRELQKRLDEVVESCVNLVGVDVNSASESLLGYVSGINKSLAQNIIALRSDKGGFTSRHQLLEAKGFGPKVFELAAGFLRIPGAKNPLDRSAVHPENYGLVEKMATQTGIPLDQLVGNAEVVKKLKVEEFIDEKVGKHTLQDILAELEKPNRDPRREFRYARFDDKVQGIQDLVTGSWMEGVITNVTNFGAFVDIGVHQDGLIHISELSQNFVKDAKNVITVGDVVKVRVMAVDVEQKRISLSMKDETVQGSAAPQQRGQRAGGKRPDNRGERGGRPGSGNQKGGGKPPIQAHATIADLKAQLAGKSPASKGAKKVPQPVKLAVSIKQIMRSGR